MMDAYVAARELERLKAGRSGEFARQLPLHQAEISQWQDPETGGAARTEPGAGPDWATDY